MVEYLYDAIRATAGEDIAVAAIITDVNSIPLLGGCSLELYENDTLLISVGGEYDETEKLFTFTIPADVTKNKRGRYWYYISDSENSKLNFKQPIYLV